MMFKEFYSKLICIVGKINYLLKIILLQNNKKGNTMKNLLPIILLPLFVFMSCEDDDNVDECNDAVDAHTEALEVFEEVQALYEADPSGFTGDASYVELCEDLAELAEAGLDECPESFGIYEDWTAEDFEEFKSDCSMYGGE